MTRPTLTSSARPTDPPRVLLLSGTGEGPTLAAALLDAGCSVRATVTRDEAAEHLFAPLRHRPGFHAEKRGFTEQNLTAFLQSGGADAVLDATHPFAVRITQMAASACERTGVPRIRYERPSPAPPDDVEWAESFSRAAEMLPDLADRAVLTIGARQLKHFAHLHDRVTMFARVLPSPGSIQQAIDAGFARQRLLGLRPPFSRAFNRALFEHCGAELLLTKDSGEPGGVPEKVRAAQDLGMKVLMIRRPAPPADAVDRVEDAVAACLQALGAG
jgi:precorrin-6x reductase